MNSRENLLLTAMEECAEIQQAISKALRFGLDCYNPLDPTESNVKSIMTEYYQLIAVIEMLQECDVLPCLTGEDINRIINEKREKVVKYQEISRQLGTIKD